MTDHWGRNWNDPNYGRDFGYEDEEYEDDSGANWGAVYEDDEYYDDDDDHDGYWDWWGSDDEDTDESDGGDERSIGTPPSDLSDIPF